MIARLTFAALMILLGGWLYILTCRVQVLIDLAEQLIDRDHVVLPEPVPLFRKLRAAAEWVDAHMQPVMAEGEEPEVVDLDLTADDLGDMLDSGVPVEIVAPAHVVKPSPVPRKQEPEQPATVPMHQAFNESAAELTEQQQWEAEQEAKYAAAMARIEEMAKGVA